MAWDIVLKGKNGNTTDYTNVRYIDIPSPNGEVASFLNTEVGACYYSTLSEVEGVYRLTIKGMFFAANTSRTIFGIVSDGMCKEWGLLTESGDYRIVILMCTKNLQIGKTYTLDEIDKLDEV